jgi:hypothetical protein
MNAEQKLETKQHRLGNILSNSSTAFRVAIGSVLGALIILFFSVVYSHEIFFSDRWDPYKPKYLEIWFFTIAIVMLIPIIMRSIKKELLVWYARTGTVATFVALIIWLVSIWPISTMEAAYTSIGYAFEENIVPFEITLHLAASTVSSIFLLLVAVPRPLKANAFKDVFVMICGSLAIGTGFCYALIGFGYPGLHVLFWVSIFSLAALVALEFLPGIVMKEKPETIYQDTTRIVELEEESNAGKKRSIIFALVLIMVCFLVMLFIPEKSLSGVAEIIPLLIPSVEAIAILIKFLVSRVSSKNVSNKSVGSALKIKLAILFFAIINIVAFYITNIYSNALTIILIWVTEAFVIIIKLAVSRVVGKVSAPRAYGNIMLSWLAFTGALIGGVVILVGAGYYRDLQVTMAIMLPAMLAGFIAGYIIKNIGDKKKSQTESGISKRYHLILIAGFCIVAIVSVAIWMTWQEFLHTAPIDPDTQTPDSRDVPFLGIAGMIPGGVAIGLLVFAGIGSIGEYHRKTTLSRDVEPAWNANATSWLVLLLPASFYFGQVYFGTRIYEWAGHIQTNLENSSTTSLLVGIVLLVFAIWVMTSLVIVIARARHANYMPSILQESRPGLRRQFSAPAIIVVVFLASIAGSALVMKFPRMEPSWNQLIVQNDAFTLWSTYPAAKVSQKYLPGTFQSTVEELEITMAAGETERVHIILTPVQDVENIRLNMSSFRKSVNETFPATGLNWYYVTYNLGDQEEHLVPGNPYQYRGRDNVSSIYLSQINTWGAMPGLNLPIWLSFTSAYNTTAGTYTGNVTLSWNVDGTPGSLLIRARVDVLDYKKPIAYRFGTFLGANTNNSTVGKMIWRCDRTGYYPGYSQFIPPTFVQSINWTAKTYVLNFTRFNAALNACAQAGYMHQIWNSFTTAALAVTDPAPFSANWNETVTGILAQMEANLTATLFDLPHGQGKVRAIDLIYDEIYDEPGKDDAYRFRIGQLIKQNASDYKLMCTCGISKEAASWPGWSGPGGVYDVIKVRVTGPLAFQEYFDDPSVRQLYADYPAENWIYWINSPWPPYPNSAQAYNTGSGLISQVVQYYVLTNVTGFLFWTAGDTAWADGGDGYEGWGSGRYFYLVDDGSNSYDVGYRFELLDDGLEIGEMVRHLDAMIAGTTGALNASTMQQARSIRAAFESMFPNFRAYPDPQHVGDLYALRLELLEFLAINT